MRRIDADALANRIYEKWGIDPKYEDDSLDAMMDVRCLELINSAPTIEPKQADDLISRADAIEALEKAKERYFDRAVVIARMQDVLRDIPSAQPKIVRCKECKYRDDFGCHNPIWDDEWLNYPSPTPSDDDFCSYGERREE